MTFYRSNKSLLIAAGCHDPDRQRLFHHQSGYFITSGYFIKGTVSVGYIVIHLQFDRDCSLLADS